MIVRDRSIEYSSSGSEGASGNVGGGGIVFKMEGVEREEEPFERVKWLKKKDAGIDGSVRCFEGWLSITINIGSCEKVHQVGALDYTTCT